MLQLDPTTAEHPLVRLLLDDKSWDQTLIPASSAHWAYHAAENFLLKVVTGQLHEDIVQITFSWVDNSRTLMVLKQLSPKCSAQFQCTCPRGRGNLHPSCPHAHAAVATVRLAQRPGYKQKHELNAWESLFGGQPEPKHESYHPPGEYHYALKVFTDSVGDLRVQPFAVYPSGVNRYRSVNLEFNSTLTPQPPAGMPVQIARHLAAMHLADLNTVRNFRVQRHHQYAEERGFDLSNPDQAWHFLQVAPHLPIYWMQARKPFAWGPARQLTYAWEDVDDGQRLQRHLDGVRTDTTLYPVSDGLLYADAAASLVGPITGSRDAYVFSTKFPLLSDGNAYRVRKWVASLPHDWGIPLPDARKPVHDLRVPPRPVLRLIDTGLPRVGIGFDYGGHRTPLENSSFFEVANPEGLLHVYRDITQEEELRKKVRSVLPLRPTDAGLHILDDDHLKRGIDSFEHYSRQIHQAAAQIDALVEVPPLHEYRLASMPASFIGDVDQAAGAAACLDVGLGIEVDGKPIDLLPILVGLLSSGELTAKPRPNEKPDDALWVDAGDRTLVPLNISMLREAIAPIFDWLRKGKLTAENKLRIRASAYSSFEEVQQVGHAEFQASAAAQRLLARIANRRTVCLVSPRFQGELREYQQEGLNWMAFLADCHFGGLLGDDMGLGKTVQVIAHIVTEKDRGDMKGPVLVVTLRTVLGQWVDRFAQFAPHLRVLVLDGFGRGSRYGSIPDADVVLMTWDSMWRDAESLRAYEFALFVMDETKRIKNHATEAAKGSRRIRAHRRLALGGTPIENNLGEFWAILDAVEPGILGTTKEFAENYRTPIERHGDPDAIARLVSRTRAICLRRTKAQVASHLPPKTEELVHVEFGSRQALVYESTRAMLSPEILSLLQEKGITGKGNEILTKLMKLRRACCSPRLLYDDPADHRADAGSAKEDWVTDNVPAMIAEGRRILLFSEFTSMLKLLSQHMTAAGIEHSYMDGDSSDSQRTAQTELFTSGKTRIYLISRKAGGVGLDLPQADTIIQYEPDWNPSNENQAADRAHRVTTVNPVMIYKLIARGTLEDQMLVLQQRKLRLSAAILDGRGAGEVNLTEEDVRALLAPMERRD